MALMMCPGCNRAVSKYNNVCPYCKVNLDISVRCPKCKSPNVIKLDKNPFMFKLVLNKNCYICTECQNKFHVNNKENV